MSVQAEPSVLRFGPFQLDRRTGELQRDGRRVRLQEQPRQVLLALLERPGEIVTRDDLRRRLWSAETFVDFERGLNTAVKKVRQALGDSAETPRFIETLARRGYRFIATVESTEPAAELVAAEPAPPAPGGNRRRPLRRWLAAAAIVASLGTAGLATWRWLRAGDGAKIVGTPTATAGLAVLPLRVLGGSPAESYLGVGIADAITTRLANTRQLALRPTSAVLPFQNAQSDPTRIAASLQVQHLLLGTIQTTGEGYRVSVQLVRADGVAVWGRSFDEPRGGLLPLQDHIADQVAGALHVELSPRERKRLHPRHTSNAAAHDRFLRGRSLLVNYTEANMRDAVAFFEQALALDADYALARASLATACAWFSVRYAYEHDARAWGARAEQEARRALKQDYELADAHFALASAAGTLHGGFAWHDVLAHSAEALLLDPSLELAHVARMRAFYHLGLFEQAMEEARLARSVNPTPSIELSRLEVASRLFAGDFAESARLAGELLERTDAPAIRHYLGLAKYYTGNVAEARTLLASATRGGKPDARAQASLASVEAAAGLHTEARARIATIVAAAYMDHHVAYSLGAAFAQLGDTNRSLEWLQQAADTGFPSVPWYARDPLLQPVRKDPRFAGLMARLREAQSSHR